MQGKKPLDNKGLSAHGPMHRFNRQYSVYQSKCMALTVLIVTNGRITAMQYLLEPHSP
jgi:hypothetical protein